MLGPDKTKIVRHIEEKMAGLTPGSIRYQVLESAKEFKGGWFKLGQYLYTVYKDKLYKEWGFLSFENYCQKEIGIRQQTAVKLLKSYFFIEKDEPALVSSVPDYEAVNVLRLAKGNANIDDQGYQELKKGVFESSKDFAEVGRQFRSMLKSAREQGNPDEEHKKAFQSKVRRIISNLKSIKFEDEIKNILPARILKQLDELIAALEDKMEE